LAIDGKSLSQDEQRIQSSIDQALRDLADETYQRIASEADNHVNLWYIADVFEGQNNQLWIDGWGHITPEANLLVAEEILAALDNQLADQ
jgi:hypothetical protein